MSHLVLDLYNEAQVEFEQSFATGALQRMKKILRFDSAATTSFRSDADGRFFVTSFASLDVVPNKGELRAEFIGPETFDRHRGLSSRDPLLTRCVSKPGRTHCYSVHERTDRRLAEYARRGDSEHSMSFIQFDDGGESVSALTFWRTRRGARFCCPDVQLADDLLPHVRQALRINQKLMTSALTGRHGGCGVVVAEPCGAIHHIDDIALVLLRREFPFWLSHELPKEVVREIVADGARQYLGRQIVLKLRRRGTVLVLAVTARAACPGLTPAELRAVDAIVRHGSYKEAARHLELSPATVRNQLHAVYRKLGIRGKTGLVKSFGHDA